jgi:pimeloyl-ACP methyl ester carboxylesterase
MTDAKLLAGFDERVAQVKGRRLRYFLAGPEGGRPLVLVHGLAGAASNWALVAPALARTRRVLVVELPGHGGSEPLPVASTLDPYADRVARVAGLEGFENAAYVGHSFGGLVALRLAIQEPERVSAVVLAAAAGIGSSTRLAERALAFVGFVRPGRRVSPYWRAVARSTALKRAVFAPWFAADPAALSDAAVEGTLRDVNLHTDTDSAWRALTRDDPRSDLHLVGCPSLVLWGAGDNQLPLDDAYDYARRLRASVRVVADCGHLLILERPEACIDAIESFLGGVEKS